MKQVTLQLDEFQQRPVVRLNRLRALLDSGAYIPVWVDDKHHRLNITIPDDESLIRNLRVVDKEGNLHVLCSSMWEKDAGEF